MKVVKKLFVGVIFAALFVSISATVSAKEIRSYLPSTTEGVTTD